jgi:hypothetical protein
MVGICPERRGKIMTDYQVRTLINKTNNLCRLAQEASSTEREATILLTLFSTALLGLLEYAEANHPGLVDGSDWSTVKHFYTVEQKIDS